MQTDPPFDLSTLTMTEIVRLQNRLQQELTRRFERPIALVFSDIVGSTPYFARFGDGAGRQLQQVHIDLLTACIKPAGGRIVDTVGDGAFFVFPSVTAAITGVIDFQRQMARTNETRGHEHQLQVRIGMHWGLVLTDGEAVSGDAVNLSSRVAASAAPGELRLTRAVFQELAREQRLNCRSMGPVPLKGFERPVELMALDWRDPHKFPRSLWIEETKERIELPQQDIITFGRLHELNGARANDIVLIHPDPHMQRQISRWHFELRRSEHGVRLLALSDSTTFVDGVRVERGVASDVRSGSRIRVGEALNLRLLGPEQPEIDIDDGATMVEGRILRTTAPLGMDMDKRDSI